MLIGGHSPAPDDGYLYDHLVYHLDQLAASETRAAAESRSLFADDAWLQARVSGAGYLYDGYLADLDVVWKRAHQETLGQIEAGEAPEAFAGCVRYALIRTSINSLSSNYVSALVARAVETGLWSDQRAFSVAIRIPDPTARAGALTSIMAVTSLRPEVRALVVQSALAAAGAIRDEDSRARTLAALAPQLSGEEKASVLAQALAAAGAIRNEDSRARALAALVCRVQDKGTFPGEIRLAATQCLWSNLRHQGRENLLSFCSETELFRPSVFDTHILSRIAGAVIEICTEWRWL